MSVSLWPHGLYSQWNSPGQTTGVSSLSLLKGVFPTQGSNSGHPCCKCILYQLSYQGSSKVNMIIYFLMLKAFQVLYIPFMRYLSFLFMHLKLTISLLQGFLDSWIGKNSPAMWETWVGKISWRRESLPTLIFWHGLQRVRQDWATFTFNFPLHGSF